MRIILITISLLFLICIAIFIPRVNAQEQCIQPPSTAGASVLSVTTNSRTYRVWSRMKAADSVNNSYYLKIDNNCPVLIGDSPAISNANWSWVDYQSGITSNKLDVSFTAGEHIITLIGNEPGVGVDKILLTQNLSCIPIGTGDNCPSELPTPIITPTLSPTPIPTNSPTPTLSPSPQPSTTPTPIPSIVSPAQVLEPNLIINPSFENRGSSWLSPWLFLVRNGAKGSVSQVLRHADGKYSAKININKATPDDFNVRLYYANINLKKDSTYELSFWARASSKGEIRVNVQNPNSSSNYFQQNLLITTQWQKYTFNFTVPTNDSVSMLIFNLSQKRRDVLLDFVSLSKIE